MHERILRVDESLNFILYLVVQSTNGGHLPMTMSTWYMYGVIVFL